MFRKILSGVVLVLLIVALVSLLRPKVASAAQVTGNPCNAHAGGHAIYVAGESVQDCGAGEYTINHPNGQSKVNSSGAATDVVNQNGSGDVYFVASIQGGNNGSESVTTWPTCDDSYAQAVNNVDALEATCPELAKKLRAAQKAEAFKLSVRCPKFINVPPGAPLPEKNPYKGMNFIVHNTADPASTQVLTWDEARAKIGSEAAAVYCTKAKVTKVQPEAPADQPKPEETPAAPVTCDKIVGSTFTIAVRLVNLRAEHNGNANKIGFLRAGESFVVTNCFDRGGFLWLAGLKEDKPFWVYAGTIN